MIFLRNILIKRNISYLLKVVLYIETIIQSLKPREINVSTNNQS